MSTIRFKKGVLYTLVSKRGQYRLLYTNTDIPAVQKAFYLTSLAFFLGEEACAYFREGMEFRILEFTKPKSKPKYKVRPTTEEDIGLFRKHWRKGFPTFEDWVRSVLLRSDGLLDEEKARLKLLANKTLSETESAQPA